MDFGRSVLIQSWSQPQYTDMISIYTGSGQTDFRDSAMLANRAVPVLISGL
uniref:Uncharacterized protein n=1 Tax=Amphimedon queenslandica TaxID=400682 RepID=A0A1X7UM24_AMPQE